MGRVAENSHGGGLGSETAAAPGFRPENGEEAHRQQTGGLRGVEQDASALCEAGARGGIERGGHQNVGRRLRVHGGGVDPEVPIVGGFMVREEAAHVDREFEMGGGFEFGEREADLAEWRDTAEREGGAREVVMEEHAAS